MSELDSASAFVKPTTDYRALRKEIRARRRSRRTVEHPICLDSALLDEYADLQEQDRRETLAGIGRDPEKPDPTRRAGDLDTKAKIAAVEEQMRANSVVGVFVVPDPEAMAKSIAEMGKVQDTEDRQKIEDYAIASARETVLNTFDHFEDADGNTIPAEAYGLEDLKELVADWTRGQLFGLTNRITNRATEVPELPLSGRR